jgi:hypothetical protein
MPIKVEVVTDFTQRAIPIDVIEPGTHRIFPHRVDGEDEIITIHCLANDFGGQVFVATIPKDALQYFQPLNPNYKSNDIRANTEFSQKLALGAGKTALFTFKHYCSGKYGTPN